MNNTLYKIGRHQAINLSRFLKGQPLTFPAFGSMTLDMDDVRIAKHWLENRDSWRKRDQVRGFEHEFADWDGAKYARAFMSGREALSACIYSLDLKPEDEVIIPGYTCVVVANAFRYEDIVVRFCDIELDTFGPDIEDVERKITDRTKAILIQHLYGLVCRDYRAIVEMARSFDLKLIEDCAHATGAEFLGRKVGNLGDVAFYSSEQSKVFNTIQGGLATTNDKNIGERLGEYADRCPEPDDAWIDKQLHSVILNYYRFKHPQKWWRGDATDLMYRNKLLISTTKEEERGIRPKYYGRIMPDPIAAIGRNQLKKIDRYNEQRRRTAHKWDAWCDKAGYKKPVVIPDSKPVFLRYPVIVEKEKKQDRSWARAEAGTNAGVWFVSNLHPSQQPVEGCPNADVAVRQCVNFPTLGA